MYKTVIAIFIESWRTRVPMHYNHMFMNTGDMFALNTLAQPVDVYHTSYGQYLTNTPLYNVLNLEY